MLNVSVKQSCHIPFTYAALHRVFTPYHTIDIKMTNVLVTPCCNMPFTNGFTALHCDLEVITLVIKPCFFYQGNYFKHAVSTVVNGVTSNLRYFVSRVMKVNM